MTSYHLDFPGEPTLALEVRYEGDQEDNKRRLSEVIRRLPEEVQAFTLANVVFLPLEDVVSGWWDARTVPQCQYAFAIGAAAHPDFGTSNLPQYLAHAWLGHQVQDKTAWDQNGDAWSVQAGALRRAWGFAECDWCLVHQVFWTGWTWPTT